MKDILNRNFLKNYIYLYLLILFFSFSFFDFLPHKKIIISSLDESNGKNRNYIVILGIHDGEKVYDLNKIFLENKKLKENAEGLSFIKKGQMGYGSNVIYTTNSKNKIVVDVKRSFFTKIVFYNIGIKKILIESGREKRVVDIQGKKKGEAIEYFPFYKELVYYYLNTAFLLFSLMVIITFLFRRKKGV